MNLKMLKAICVFLMISTSFLGNVAHAGLIVGSTTDTTIDTVTDYEWLDFSFTAGMSYNDVLNSSYVINDGYEIATLIQVRELWVNAGRYTDPNVAANSIFSLMGCMSFLYGYNCDQVGEEWTGAFFKSDDDNTRYALVDTRDGANALFLESWYYITNQVSPFRSDTAAYLVRTQSQSAQVPEPYSIAIFALGIMGLASRRFKKQ